MQTKQIIQGVAQIIQITSLRKGDVVKMVDKEYNDNLTMAYAIVTDILNDGAKTFVEFLKYKKTYNEVKPELVLIAGDKEITIFPANPADVEVFFADTRDSIMREITKQEEELAKKRELMNRFEGFVSGELGKQLTTPEHTTLGIDMGVPTE